MKITHTTPRYLTNREARAIRKAYFANKKAGTLNLVNPDLLQPGDIIMWGGSPVEVHHVEQLDRVRPTVKVYGFDWVFAGGAMDFFVLGAGCGMPIKTTTDEGTPARVALMKAGLA